MTTATLIRPRVRVGRGCAGPEPRKPGRARGPATAPWLSHNGSADRDKAKREQAIDAEASGFNGVHPCSSTWSDDLKRGISYPEGMTRCRRCHRDCPPIVLNAGVCCDCAWHPPRAPMEAE